MTASEHLKGVACRHTIFCACTFALAIPTAWIPNNPSQGIVNAVAGFGAAVWLAALWTAWALLWRAEMHSAIESVELYEGTAQMQRRIIEQRNEIEKLKRR